MTVHGVLEVRSIVATSGQANSEVYVSLTRFLTSSFAQSIGIQRIAYNTGSAATGQDYWDSASPIGNNAWGCYKWLSASVPFYMLVQFANNTNFGTAPGNPGAIDTSSSAAGVGFAFAMCADGTSPWNGTTLNNGQDNKGSTVWAQSGSVKPSLYVWPRINSLSASKEALKEDTLGVVSGFISSCRFNFICDENNIFTCADNSLTDSYVSLFFGAYTPRSGTNPVSPYVCIRNSVGNDPTFTYANYGSYTTAAGNNGGIGHPHSAVSGTRIVALHTVSNFLTAQYSPNGAVSDDGVWDEWPLYVAMNDSPTYGYCGYIDFIRAIYGVYTHQTNNDATRAFFGGATYLSGKVSVPWLATVNPGKGITREGVMF